MANDYIETINNEKSLQLLLAADFTFNKSFNLLLADKEIFAAQRILRIMPKKRIVAYGHWRGKEVVAKLFFDSNAEKELNGIAILKQNQIPTTTVLYKDKVGDNAYIILFSYLDHAESLQDWWLANKNGTNHSILFNCMVELATHHVLGVVQKDLHLKNFLIKDNHIFMIDGADVSQENPLLSRKASIKSVALFLSQLGIGHEALQEKLFKHYAKSRGWLLKEEDVKLVFAQIKRWNAIRWEKYKKKIFRNSSLFVTFKKNGFQGIFRREYASKDFLEILKNPDAAFIDPRAELLKDGRSATVIKFKLDDRIFIIKRHNMKHWLHRLRRYVRTTRALKVWRLTNKLDLFTVPVAKPIAFLEKRILGLHTNSYYFSEVLEGISLGEYVQEHRHDEERIGEAVRRVINLMKNITKLKIAHGDLKETNVLLTQSGNPVLIDYDTAHEHSSLTRLKQAWQRDVRRLLRNFINEPVVTKKIKEALT